MTAGVPKRIIQIWGGGSEPPLLSKASAANLTLLNPDFEYLRFDDGDMESFVAEKCPQYRGLFRGFRLPVQRYDFFRYLAVYHLGGFYFDMDVFLASGLSDLSDAECVFPFEALTMNRFLRDRCGMDWEIGTYAFGAVARHPFIGAVIENCVRAQRDMKWAQAMMISIPRIFWDEFLVLYTTGALLVSRTLAECPDAARHVKVLFPENVCDPGHWNRFGRYGVHLMNGGWRNRRGLLRRRVYALWKTWNQRAAIQKAGKVGQHRSLVALKRPVACG